MTKSIFLVEKQKLLWYNCYIEMKVGDTMREIMEKVQSIIDKYNEQLAANGIKITASKRYFEESVGERIGNTGNTAIFNAIERELYRKREEKKGYNHVRNRYHCIVLSVAPVPRDIVCREYCRDYAFVLKKVERPHIGMEPMKITYEEKKLLSKIEKRIEVILSKAQKYDPQKVCKDTLLDAVRYTASQYGYKRRFLNKERADWELIFLISFSIIALVVAILIWLMGKLI